MNKREGGGDLKIWKDCKEWWNSGGGGITSHIMHKTQNAKGQISSHPPQQPHPPFYSLSIPKSLSFKPLKSVYCHYICELWFGSKQNVKK